jgi:hypothetical protein
MACRLLAAAGEVVEAVPREARDRGRHRVRCFNDNWTYCKVAADPSPPLQAGTQRVAPFRRSAPFAVSKGGAGPLLQARGG